MRYDVYLTGITEPFTFSDLDLAAAFYLTALGGGSAAAFISYLA